MDWTLWVSLGLFLVLIGAVTFFAGVDSPGGRFRSRDVELDWLYKRESAMKSWDRILKGDSKK